MKTVWRDGQNGRGRREEAWTREAREKERERGKEMRSGGEEERRSNAETKGRLVQRTDNEITRDGQKVQHM